MPRGIYFKPFKKSGLAAKVKGRKHAAARTAFSESTQFSHVGLGLPGSVLIQSGSLRWTKLETGTSLVSEPKPLFRKRPLGLKVAGYREETMLIFFKVMILKMFVVVFIRSIWF